MAPQNQKIVLSNFVVKDYKDNQYWARKLRLEKVKKSDPSAYKREKSAFDEWEKSLIMKVKRQKTEKKALEKARKTYEKKYKDKWVAVIEGEYNDWWMILTGEVRIIFKGFIPIAEFRLCFTSGGAPFIWLPEKSFVITRKYTDDE